FRKHSRHRPEKPASAAPRFPVDDQPLRHFQHHPPVIQKKRLRHFWHTSATDFAASDRRYYQQLQPDAGQSWLPEQSPMPPSPERSSVQCPPAALASV